MKDKYHPYSPDLEEMRTAQVNCVLGNGEGERTHGAVLKTLEEGGVRPGTVEFQAYLEGLTSGVRRALASTTDVQTAGPVVERLAQRFSSSGCFPVRAH